MVSEGCLFRGSGVLACFADIREWWIAFFLKSRRRAPNVGILVSEVPSFRWIQIGRAGETLAAAWSVGI